MKYFLSVVMILLMSNSFLLAQESNKFVVVTIEKESKTRLHKKQNDYWIVNIDLWKDNKEAIFPLYISGFSATDYNECCLNNNLILFNVTVNESYDYSANSLKSQDDLIKIIKENRKRVQNVKKTWISRGNEKIKVYLTPISGEFCFCGVSHKTDNSNIGYDGQIAIPNTNILYDKSFWDSKISSGISRYDFASLRFMSLHTTQ